MFVEAVGNPAVLAFARAALGLISAFTIVPSTILSEVTVLFGSFLF